MKRLISAVAGLAALAVPSAVGRRLPRGRYQVRVGAHDPYGRRIVGRGKRSRLRR